MSLKFNPFTGTFDFVGAGSTSPDNFSYKKIDTGQSVRIPDGQEMIVGDEITIDGTLVIDGQLTILDLSSDSRCPLNPIPAGKVMKVYDNEQCLYFGPLVIDGTLINDGEIVIL